MTLTVASLGTAALYALISFLLFVFGANLTTFAVRVSRRGRRTTASLPPATGDDLPMVTVQLPIFNELYVSERIIRAACDLDWPRHLLQIQVLDDSTDETSVLIARLVDAARADGINIEHLHRTNRTGYKAGALAEGMHTATGEYVAIFDADFVPPTDFLRRTVPHFDDAGVAFVQARWGHLNREYSWLTKVQALAIDGHFLVEQSGRGDRGWWFNFNGTAGIWRAAAMADAGGWQARTLTEDLDLSYRAHLRGWTARYLEDLVVPAELPAQVLSFRRQQHRWARGSMECAGRLLPSVWRAPVSLGTRFQATVHLLAYGIHLLLLLLLLIYPLVIVAGVRHASFSTLFGVAYVFALTSLAPGIFFIAGQRQAGRSWVREVPRIVFVTIFGSGLMLNTARAALQIFTRPNPEFERTAKFGLDQVAEAGEWTRRRYQLNVDRIAWAELALGGWAFATAAFAFSERNWGILLYAIVFGSGLVMMSGATFAHAIAVHRGRERRRASIEAERSQWSTV